MPVSPPLAAGGEICTASDLLALLTITDSYITLPHADKVLFCLLPCATSHPIRSFLHLAVGLLPCPLSFKL
jgi:hypothetical protein